MGIALCGWTKLTILLMVGFSVLITEGLRLWSERKRRSIGAYAILSAGFLVAAVPNLVNIAAYGRVLYHSSAFYVQPAQRVSLSVAHYSAVFLRNMVIKWSALEPSSPLAQLGLYLVLALAVAAMVFGVRQMRRAAAANQEPDAGPGWLTACAMIGATAPVLLLHLYFGWRTFAEDGFVEMAQDRYYYGVWPGFALGLALLWRASQGWVLKTPVTIVTAALLVLSSVAATGVALLVNGQTTMG